MGDESPQRAAHTRAAFSRPDGAMGLSHEAEQPDPLHARERIREQLRARIRAAIADLELWGISRARLQMIIRAEGPERLFSLWAENRPGDEQMLDEVTYLKHRAIGALMGAPRGNRFP